MNNRGVGQKSRKSTPRSIKNSLGFRHETKTIQLSAKQEAIAFAVAHPERSLKIVAANLGVDYSTLDKRVRQHRAQAGPERKLSADQERIKQLEKENAHLREVNEIVKKAHVYFVNNPSR